MYGQVIIEYVSPSGKVDAYEILNTASAVQNNPPLLVSCNLQPISIPGINSTISEYSANPQQNITCTLLDNVDNIFPQGVESYIYMNGHEYDPQPSNAVGQVSFPPPVGGWPIETLIFKTASSIYTLGDAIVQVTPYQNPLSILFGGVPTNSTVLQGDSMQIVPGVFQHISVSLANGTVLKYATSSPINVTALGNVKITASNSSYGTFSRTVTFSQIPLTLKITDSSQVYTYRSYQFILTNNGNIYNYNGPVYIGNTELVFSDGIADGFLTNNNLSVSVPGGKYLISPGFSIGLAPVDIVLPSQVYTGTIYRFYLESNKSTVPFSGSITMLQGNKTIAVPVSDGSGIISFSSADPVTLSNSPNSTGISPFAQKLVPTEISPFYFQPWFIGLVVLGMFSFILGPQIYKKTKGRSDYSGDGDYILN